ncbi:MAG: sialate O-acetylesterase [Lentilactobacillus diolivorans]|uniref:Sialate O-acetylesterase domain-containing protein n=1 Tax=Lentilactobacillus diolivorans TaxID=179838 RepID=A0ABQ0XEV4_9LACO|nr:sialate O-acetylesterase [Lentilactobacillus diolivorans]GEP24530.1 hypothetical protein LDI01_21230 [Lentilactobacillus diolivorans]
MPLRHSEVDINALTASMYLKGAAPKSSSPAKKLAIISAGQSNIDGRVPLADLPDGINIPFNNCYYCSNYTPHYLQGKFENGIHAADLDANRWGFDLITYYYLTQLAQQETYVMKWSQGGTSIDPTGDNINHWTAFYEQLDSPDHSLLCHFEHLIRQCMFANADKIEIRAMLWHQGEADRQSYSPLAAEHYYQNLKAVFAYCRGIIGNSQLPIFTGTISHSSEQFDPVIDAIIRQIGQEDPNVHLIDMAGASLLDNWHFDSLSSTYFGKAIYNQMISAGIVAGPQVSLKRPW